MMTCNDGQYSKHTLELAYELPFAGLFDKYNRGRQKYEASSVIIVRPRSPTVTDDSIRARGCFISSRVTHLIYCYR